MRDVFVIFDKQASIKGKVPVSRLKTLFDYSFLVCPDIFD